MLTRPLISIVLLVLVLVSIGRAQVPIPADAPQPHSPAKSAEAVELPDGYQLKLVAAEPLIRNPSGVCWDERGRLFVCELHGYNLEGQYDIEELNKTGKLDKVVRRLPAPKEAQQRAQKDQTGTVKRLVDLDGDGRMDKAHIWADDLPACFGIVPARGGVIVVCSPDIVYLADRDGDDVAEVREVLFTGLTTGILERRNNAPKWGLDNWIYVGRGQGGTITGPHLKGKVKLSHNDFRFKADGTAIEPLVDGTHTFGFAFSESGDRFVISTGSPAIYLAPLPWRYLSRNPAVSFGSLRVDVGPGQRTYPISKPHPWRSRRADDKGFETYYRTRYGAAESAPNGYFTSACSPLVYQDDALPGLRGQLFACEPAQNLVHRSVISRDRLIPQLRRPESELEKEFLASRDIWFHPIALSHAPDGSIAIVDFYREIIEDYSAIPRYLQQQYRLNHGENHGRIWRLVHDEMKTPQLAKMNSLDGLELSQEVASSNYWRRQTSRRILVERQQTNCAGQLKKILGSSASCAAQINALHSLDGIGALDDSSLMAALRSKQVGVVVQALRLSDRQFDDHPDLLAVALQLVTHPDPRVQLQLALSLGESKKPEAKRGLAQVVLRAGQVRWLHEAALSSLATGGEEMLAAILNTRPNGSLPATAASSSQESTGKFLFRLCAMLSNGRDPSTLSSALCSLNESHVSSEWQRACLAGMKSTFQKPRRVKLTPAAKSALQSLLQNRDQEISALAKFLVISMRVESAEQRRQRLARATQSVGDLRLPVSARIAAVNELATDGDPQSIQQLLAVFQQSTPPIQNAILDAAFLSNENLPLVVSALERKHLPLSAISAVQRSALLELSDARLQSRAKSLVKNFEVVPLTKLKEFAEGLPEARNAANGALVFKKHCANCHQAHGVGIAVGPDLTAEFRRSESTFVKDILAPSSSISSGYSTYAVETVDGLNRNGILVFESPTGITLRQAEGKQQTILRKDILSIRSLNISLMPDNLGTTLKPAEVADLIAWIRQPGSRRVLFDDDPEFVQLLVDGQGRATLELGDRHRGTAALRVTPPQRYSSRIPNWTFEIREKPKLGQFRYLRFAWKAVGAKGLMIELANRGSWPPAKQPQFRYFAGGNTTGWQATRVSDEAPDEWQVITRDLWKDFGDCTITGIAPTAIGGAALFDAIELLREH